MVAFLLGLPLGVVVVVDPAAALGAGRSQKRGLLLPNDFGGGEAARDRAELLSGHAHLEALGEEGMEAPFCRTISAKKQLASLSACSLPL